MPDDDLLQQLAKPLMDEHEELGPGTMMGSPCLRFGERFVAMVQQPGGELVVWLPEGRVRELVEQGTGEPFAPNGEPYREWVTIPSGDETLWRAILEEAVERAALAEAGGEHDD